MTNGFPITAPVKPIKMIYDNDKSQIVVIQCLVFHTFLSLVMTTISVLKTTMNLKMLL